MALAASLFTGCLHKINFEAEQAEVKTVLDQYNQASEKEDMALLESLFAHDADMLLIGTDANEWWVGWPGFKKAVEQQFAAFEQTKITISDQTIHVHGDGLAAWVAEKMNFTIMTQGQNVEVAIRFTCVLEKRQGRWLIVQGHASVPASGQVVTY
jgi:uncharacterized protein (TIGR02246 family)